MRKGRPELSRGNQNLKNRPDGGGGVGVGGGNRGGGGGGST